MISVTLNTALTKTEWIHFNISTSRRHYIISYITSWQGIVNFFCLRDGLKSYVPRGFSDTPVQWVDVPFLSYTCLKLWVLDLHFVFLLTFSCPNHIFPPKFAWMLVGKCHMTALSQWETRIFLPKIANLILARFERSCDHNKQNGGVITLVCWGITFFSPLWLPIQKHWDCLSYRINQVVV